MREQLDAIYRRHGQGLFTLALAILGRADLAEDAVHEAFARLLRSGREPAGDAAAYVFAAVRNAALDLRSAGRTGDGDGQVESIYDLRDDPVLRVGEAELHERVRQTLDRMDESDRQVVVMKVYGELTFAQIAQSLEEPLPTVASRYRRALEKLREHLEPPAMRPQERLPRP